DQGKHIDVSMFDSMLALQVTAASMQAATGKLPGRIGNRHPVSVPFDTYPTKDGMVAIAVANDTLWGRLATVMGHEDLAENPDYLGDQNRSDKLEELTELVSSWTRTL
ncbi:CoA transferase, partial [Aerococcus urinae]